MRCYLRDTGLGAMHHRRGSVGDAALVVPSTGKPSYLLPSQKGAGVSQKVLSSASSSPILVPLSSLALKATK